MAAAIYLDDFKERGVVRLDKVLAIPSKDRIPIIASTKDGYNELLTAISASIKGAMGKINLRVGLSESQVVQLAAEVIDQSYEDNLALEDVLLFLGELVVGKAGKIYDRLDIPTFFELFETYREKRFQALQKIKYEKEVNFKSLGPSERISEETDAEKSAQREAMKLNDFMKHMYK